MENFLNEAFQKLRLVEEDFNVTADDGKVDELKAFVADDVEEIPEVEIFDVYAEDDEEAESKSHVGNFILQCKGCGSKFYEEEEPVYDEETESLNVSHKCPICGSENGYISVGKIAEFKPEAKNDEEDDFDPEESDYKKSEDDLADEAAFPADDKFDDEDKAADLKSKMKSKRESLRNSKYASEDSKKLDEAYDKEFKISSADDLVELNAKSFGEVFKQLADYNSLEAAEKLCDNIDQNGWGYGPMNMRFSTKADPEKWFENGPYSKGNKSDKKIEEIRNNMKLASEKIYKANLGVAQEIIDANGGLPLVISKSSIKNSYNDGHSKNYIDTYKVVTNESLRNSKYASEDSKKLDEATDPRDSKKIDLDSDFDEVDFEKYYIKKYGAGKFGQNGDKVPFYWDDIECVVDLDPEDCGIDDPDFEEEDWWDFFEENYNNGNGFFTMEDELTYAQAANKIHSAVEKFIKKAQRKYGNIKESLFKEDPEDFEDIPDPWGKREPLKNSKYASEDSKKIDEAEEQFPNPDKHEEIGEVNGVKMYHCNDCGKYAAMINGKKVKKDSKKELEAAIKSKNESLKEAVEVNATGEDEVHVNKNDDGTMDIKVGAEVPVEGESIVPLTDEEQEEIEANTEEPEDEEDLEIEDFDEESFDEMGESYLRKTYSNVESFKTSNVKDSGEQFIVEGIITYKSGAQRKTQFVFENARYTKSGKLILEGFNSTFSKSKKAFTLKGNYTNHNFISESMLYNYTVKQLNESNQKESVRIYGRVKCRK